ncbi:hypothetical protein [Actinomadura mexicana]|uniref:Uncharacterized protein n=1 Tax=Actinomadura mexicana TaxID=134959 RepID=A0A238VVG0_9ACTN|nr:hypothetical protein [Actinomadura mexicana]SNR38266.1 hypothetical protein SAMN06265355_102429 [Actinomadura mexicana]
MTDETKAPSTARNDEETTRLATNLYEHVRQLNHATAGPPSLTLPATAYTILGNLSATTYGLDQLLEQINRFFLRELQADRLGHDRGEDLAIVLDRHGRTLAEARPLLQALCSALSDAQSTINAVHFRPTHRGAASLTTQDNTYEDDAGVRAAANDFPSPITDPTLLVPPAVSERSVPLDSCRAHTQEA